MQLTRNNVANDVETTALATSFDPALGLETTTCIAMVQCIGDLSERNVHVRGIRTISESGFSMFCGSLDLSIMAIQFFPFVGDVLYHHIISIYNIYMMIEAIGILPINLFYNI